MGQRVSIPTVILKAGADCLRRQIDLLEMGIEAEIEALSRARLPQVYYYVAVDALRLDTETYYTVANDLLGVIIQSLEPDDRPKLKNEPAYKTKRRIRSGLVRHAFDKPDGD